MLVSQLRLLWLNWLWERSVFWGDMPILQLI